MATGVACDLPSADAAFNAPSLNADICNFQVKLPSFTFGFVLPSLAFPFALPFPKFGFELSCDPSNPINVSAGLEYGGGRVACFDVDAFQLDI